MTKGIRIMQIVSTKLPSKASKTPRSPRDEGRDSKGLWWRPHGLLKLLKQISLAGFSHGYPQITFAALLKLLAPTFACLNVYQSAI